MVIDLTGLTENVHTHTLGMVEAAAFSIKKPITDGSSNKIRKMHDKISDCKVVYSPNKIIGSDEKFLETKIMQKKYQKVNLQF